MKKYLFAAVGLLIGYYVGSHDIYMASDVNKEGKVGIPYPHAYNLRDALYSERQYCNALFEGLHRFYANDDNDFWFNSFMLTKEYAKIDSLNGGDWEDFYYYQTPILEDWLAVYGVECEPSEEQKDSLEHHMAIALCSHK